LLLVQPAQAQSYPRRAVILVAPCTASSPALQPCFFPSGQRGESRSGPDRDRDCAPDDLTPFVKCEIVRWSKLLGQAGLDAWQ